MRVAFEMGRAEDAMESFLGVIIGVVAGISSGFFGIGGAIILIPCLVYIFKFAQHYAQGTALAALLLPVGVFAVIKYYQAGNVNIKIAILIGMGFLIGSFIGAALVQSVPSPLLKRLFGALLLCVSIFMLLGK